MTSARFSLIVPIYDEEDNVAPLLDEIAEVLVAHGPLEVILVDDASQDASLKRMLAWRSGHDAPWLRIISLAQNSGQSAAVLAGVERATARIVMTMDGDRQNDPRDLLAMLELIESGDCQGVTGIRRARQDNWLRRQSSAIGNLARNLITGDRVTDSACGIKAFNRELFLQAPRFKGMHRFMASLVRFAGGTVIEIPVTHRPRIAGKANYGIGNRAWSGFIDCFVVRWLRSRVICNNSQEHHPHQES